MKDSFFETKSKKRFLLKQIIDITVEVMAAFAVVIILSVVLLTVIIFFGGIVVGIINKFFSEQYILLLGVVVYTVLLGITVIAKDKIFGVLFRIVDFIKSHKIRKSEISVPSRYRLLKLSEILFSAKNQKEVFLVMMAEWDEEIYQALKKNKDVKLFMINLRNTYAFLAAMWMKSPIGDLIQFVIKIAKQ